jgi:hypothetical protein
VAGVKSAAIDRSFSQYMSQYDTARMVLFDAAKGSMYTIFFGGISYGVFDPNSDSSSRPRAEVREPYGDLIQAELRSDASKFRLDPNIPFIDQITAISLEPTAPRSNAS